MLHLRAYADSATGQVANAMGLGLARQSASTRKDQPLEKVVKREEKALTPNLSLQVSTQVMHVYGGQLLHLRLGRKKPLPGTRIFPGHRKQTGVPIDASITKTLGGPDQSAGHRSPYPIKAKKK